VPERFFQGGKGQHKSPSRVQRRKRVEGEDHKPKEWENLQRVADVGFGRDCKVTHSAEKEKGFR